MSHVCRFGCVAFTSLQQLVNPLVLDLPLDYMQDNVLLIKAKDALCILVQAVGAYLL